MQHGYARVAEKLWRNDPFRQPRMSLDEGAVDPWTKPQYEWNQAHYKKALRGQVRWNVPYGDLRSEEQAILAKMRARCAAGDSYSKIGALVGKGQKTVMRILSRLDRL